MGRSHPKLGVDDLGRTAYVALSAQAREVPVLDRAAMRGPVGDYVMALAPNTEADPVAMLVQTLAWCGALIGGDTYLSRGSSERHPALIWPLLVGKTASGRKGTAEAEAIGPLSALSKLPRRRSGLSSGEGLVEAFISNDPKDDLDPRLLVVESEWETVLTRLKKPGNTLSSAMRDAYDGKPLATMTVSSREVTNHHLTIIGHITPRAIGTATSELEISNGFMNRFLVVEVQRPQLIDWPQDHHKGIDQLRNSIVSAASGGLTGEWQVSPNARNVYTQWYRQFEPWREAQPDRVANALARSSSNMLRLSLIYAVLENKADRTVLSQHMKAAKALIDYSTTSVARVFGPGMAGSDGKILEALRRSPGSKLSKEQLRSEAFSNHISKTDFSQALDGLVAAKLIVIKEVRTGGRNASIIRLA